MTDGIRAQEQRWLEETVKQLKEKIERQASSLSDLSKMMAAMSMQID